MCSGLIRQIVRDLPENLMSTQPVAMGSWPSAPWSPGSAMVANLQLQWPALAPREGLLMRRKVTSTWSF